jgi:diguanylate cyclase (GGDEF)-like protein
MGLTHSPLRWLRSLSLRSKLILACVGVELVVASVLLTSSTRLLQQALREQATAQAQQVLAIANEAVTAPLVQRDYATLQQTLTLMRSGGEGISYLALFDHRDKQVAITGWDTAQPLPPRDSGDIDLNRADHTLHLRVPIEIAGQDLGSLYVGLPTDHLRRVRDSFVQRSLAVAALALTVSVMLLSVIAFAITRHLGRLAQASQRVAAGDFDVAVPMASGDEIGRLGASFNHMALLLKQRIAALQSSEAAQRSHLLAVQEEQARLATLLGAMRSGILFVDAQQHVLYANAAFASLWGVSLPQPGTHVASLVTHITSKLSTESRTHLQVMQRGTCEKGLPAEVPDVELTTTDGRLIAQRMQAVFAAAAPKLGLSAEGPATLHADLPAVLPVGAGCIWFHKDITQDRKTQERAVQALRDPLTQLLNRRGLYEQLLAALAQARAAEPATPVALMFIDLDDFKLANDLGGHRLGDDILVAVGAALSAQLRRGETVARLGGDEFAVLCPGTTSEEAGVIAARLVQAVAGLAFSAPVGHSQHRRSLSVGCSIGVACYPLHGQSDADLMACADTAMYQAKSSGKNGWALFRNDAAHSQAETARVNWNDRIHRALQEERLCLHFQSVHRASDLGVAYYEALVRMVDESDPTRLIGPGNFILHAERSGKIRQLDRWVFEACVQQLAQADSSLCIAANLSARTLDDPDFVPFLRNLLQHHQVDPRRLHIELTETSALGDAAVVRPLIATLRAVGCAVHLDDFGGGFSSFAHLKLAEVDTIKIDGSFIRDLARDSANQQVVAALVQIAHSLNKSAVAEYVEDAATLQAVRALGVDFVQGYHLGRPAAGLPQSVPKGRLQAVATGMAEPSAQRVVKG